ncbi:alpha/beta hydrolase [Hoyosella sp. G463]|uniref:Monoacylglycerol lipase n=1 Tax=Lolliginicoccus lacisalsi TaxID=2742202 RepID=A0A927PN32_9ACTN|nr:alpha/beta hydrolase [Lolliginicoccus lacisalsi]
MSGIPFACVLGARPLRHHPSGHPVPTIEPVEHSESSFNGAQGTQIVYQVWKPDADPTAVVVIAHGLGEHARRYADVAAELTARGIAVYALDHRGHGRSAGRRLALRHWHDFLEDLGTMLEIARDAVPDVPLILLGHSMGGAIALTYALDRPRDLDALVLSAPAVTLGTGTPKVVIAVGKVLGRFLPWVPVEKIDPASVSRDPEVVERYKADPLVHHGMIPAGIARQLVLTMESLPGRIPALRVPTLVLHGSADQLTDVAGSRMIPDLVTSAECTMHVYDGLYHELFNEPERQQVLGDLLDWLAPRLAGASTK